MCLTSRHNSSDELSMVSLEKERGEQQKGVIMTQDLPPNFFPFSPHDGTVQLSYYPQAPGPIIQGQGAGPRLEYQGPEGTFLYPLASPGGESIHLQEESALG